MQPEKMQPEKMPLDIFYTRDLISPAPIRVSHTEARHRVFMLEPSDSPPVVFSSARQLLKVLTGHPQGRNWTFNRYFRVGRYAPPVVGTPVLTTLELFSPNVLIIPSTACGIDLGKRGHEVAKLLFAGFGHKIRSAGYDPDDVLQEVYRGILIRNKGSCPWDPIKSSFGHYVHMLCGCILSNYHRKHRRTGIMEHTGICGFEDGYKGDVDVASEDARLPFQEGIGALEELLVSDLDGVLKVQRQTSDTLLARRVLPLVREGYGRQEIAQMIGAPKAAVSRALSILRGALKVWSTLAG